MSDVEVNYYDDPTQFFTLEELIDMGWDEDVLRVLYSQATVE